MHNDMKWKIMYCHGYNNIISVNLILVYAILRFLGVKTPKPKFTEKHTWSVLYALYSACLPL